MRGTSALKSISRFFSFDWKLIVLVSIVLVQSYFLIDGYALLWTKRVWRLHGHPAQERSAVLAFGNKFFEYVEFLDANIPTDGKVIITRNWIGGPTGSTGIMMFFLMPREIDDCSGRKPIEECILNLTGLNSYILAVGDFPPDDVAHQVKDFIPFQPEFFYRGVYVPKE